MKGTVTGVSRVGAGVVEPEVPLARTSGIRLPNTIGKGPLRDGRGLHAELRTGHTDWE